MSMPHPNTPRVFPATDTAPRCAAPSTPSASPLTTHTPRPPSARPILSAASRPPGEAFREPTTATYGPSGIPPSTKSAGGGSLISRSRAGYPSSANVTTATPFSESIPTTSEGRKSRLICAKWDDTFSPHPVAAAKRSGGIPIASDGGMFPSRVTRLVPALAWRSEKKSHAPRSSAVGKARPPVIQRLREMLDGDAFLPHEIRDGPGDSKHPVVRPPRKPHPVNRVGKERFGVVAEGAYLTQPSSGESRVRDSLPGGLDGSRRGDTFPNHRRTFGSTLAPEFVPR